MSFSLSTRFSSRIVAALLVGSFLSAAVPLAGAAEGDVLLCGFVKNRAGWAIPQASVRFDRATPTSTAPSGIAPVKADGSFSITLPGGSFYHVTVAVNGPASDGGVYAPWSSAAYAPAKPAFLPVEGEPADCGGSPGVRLNAVAATSASRSFVTGGIVVLDAPGQGFVEVHIIDQTILPNADIGGKISLVGTARDARQQPFPVGAGLGLRLVCTADTGAGSILVKADSNFMVTATTRITCGSPASLFTTPVQNIKLWRQPVEIAVLVGDSSARTPAGPKFVENPLSGASVFVQKSVAGFVDLRQAANCGSALTQSPTGAPIDVPVGVTPTAASPYHCATSTDSRGLATLLVPWIDAGSAAHAFMIGIDAGAAYNKTSFDALTPQTLVLVNQNGTTSAAVKQDTLIWYDPTADPAPMASVAAGNVVKHVSLIYRNKANPVDVTLSSFRVTDIFGNPVANAAVQIIGLASDSTQKEFRTGADGWFTAKLSTLSTGSYAITILANGYNTRSCTAPDETLADRDANCFRLIHWDMAAVSGIATDKPTGKPMVGVKLCDLCPASGVDGSYGFEVEAGVPFSGGNANAAWVLDPLGAADRDGFGASDKALDRATVTWRLKVLDGTEGVPGATVCVEAPDGFAGLATPYKVDPCVLTNATGDETGVVYLTGMSWHALSSGVETYDIGASTVKISYHASVTGQLKETSFTFRAHADGTMVPATFSPGHETTLQSTIRIVDANTNQFLGGSVNFSLVGSSAAWMCGKECAPKTIATPVSGAQFAIYSYSPARTYTTEIQSIPDGFRDAIKQTGISPGTTTDVRAFRNLVPIRVIVLDAHTGGAVEGAAVNFVGVDAGFVCKPADDPGAAVCGGVTGATGALTLTVPWSNACFASAASATTYRVHVPHDGNANSTSGNQNVETVAMQGATVCVNIPSDAGATDVYIFASRAPAVLAGTLTSAVNAPTSATVEPLSERSSSVFSCNPARTNSPTAFPDCDGKAVAAGAFSLTLPRHGTAQGNVWPDGSWNLSFDSLGHYPEWRTLVKQSDTPAVTLWPETFTAIVTITESVPGSGPISCGQGFAGVITVTLQDVEKSAEQLPPTTANAVRGPSCTATLLNVPWLRATTATPQGQSNPDETDHYEITVTFGSRTFTVGAQLGPKAAATQVDVVRQPSLAGAYSISGKVVDIDAVGPALGLVGGIRVTAVRQTAECFGSGNSFSTTTDATGSFVLPVGCEGTYSVSLALPEGGLYQAAASSLVLVNSAEPTPSVEPFSIARTRVPVSIDVRHINDPNVPVSGTVIHLLGVDVATRIETSDHATTRTSTIVTFDGVPWGVYKVHVVPASSGILGVDEAIVVPPTAMPAPFVAFTHNAPPAGPNMVIRGNAADLDSFWGVSFVGGLVVHAVSTMDAGCVASAPVLADGSFELVVPCAGDYSVSIGQSALFVDEAARVASVGDFVTIELEHESWGPRAILVDGQRFSGFAFPNYSS